MPSSTDQYCICPIPMLPGKFLPEPARDPQCPVHNDAVRAIKVSEFMDQWTAQLREQYERQRRWLIDLGFIVQNSVTPAIRAAISFTEMINSLQREQHQDIARWENEGGSYG